MFVAEHHVLVLMEKDTFDLAITVHVLVNLVTNWKFGSVAESLVDYNIFRIFFVFS